MNFIKKAKLWLPYTLPGSPEENLVVDLRLNKLSILLGPNASGKLRH